MTGNDDDLRQRFAALRSEEVTRTPEFAAIVRRHKARHRQWTAALAAATVCAAALVSAILWVRPDPFKAHPQPAGAVATIGEWKAPTDFLLETPGREVLDTVPSIGNSQIGLWPADAKASPRGAERRRQRKQGLP